MFISRTSKAYPGNLNLPQKSIYAHPVKRIKGTIRASAGDELYAPYAKRVFPLLKKTLKLEDVISTVRELGAETPGARLFMWLPMETITERLLKGMGMSYPRGFKVTQHDDLVPLVEALTLKVRSTFNAIDQVQAQIYHGEKNFGFEFCYDRFYFHKPGVDSVDRPGLLGFYFIFELIKNLDYVPGHDAASSLENARRAAAPEKTSMRLLNREASMKVFFAEMRAKHRLPLIL